MTDYVEIRPELIVISEKSGPQRVRKARNAGQELLSA